MSARTRIDGQEGLVRMRGTRTGEPRKVDEWKIRLPDGGQARFDVCMQYENERAVFSLKGEAPHFKDCRLKHPDLNTLKDALETWAAEVIAREISADWAPALLGETIVERREDEHGARLSLTLSLERVDHMPKAPVGNRGETVIRNRIGQSTVIQRALSDDFSDCSMKGFKGELNSPEAREYFNSPFRSEHGHPVSRVVSEDFAAMNEVLDTVETFALLLAERMSARAIRDQGPAAPRELIDLMRRAVEKDQAPGPVPLGEDEFRI